MAGEAHTLVYLTMKGGVGKTTLAANVTRAMADLLPAKDNGAETKILLIDADAQCNLSQLFLTPEQLEARENTNFYQAFDSFRALEGPSRLKVSEYYNPRNNCRIELIPGSVETFSFIVAPASRQTQAEKSFAKFMAMARKEYDLIVLDTNPSATFVTLQSLAVSDFLVSPITFDSFSLKGIDLIIREMARRHRWLTNPRQICIVPNKVKRAHDHAARARQEEDEQQIVDKFPRLEESVLLSRVHESRFLDSVLGRRGLGFAIDQNVRGIHRNHLARVSADFQSVGNAILVALAEAFEHEAKDKGAFVRAIRKKFSSFLGGDVARP